MNMPKMTSHLCPVLVFLLLGLATGAAAEDSSELVQKALGDSTFTWKSLSGKGVEVYYLEGSFAEKHRAVLLRSAEAMIAEVLGMLEEPEYDRPLKIFYLESRDQMIRIAGGTYAGYSDWGGHAILVVVNAEWRSFEKHEFAHVVTMGRWGRPQASSTWMIEAIPVWADGWCREYTVDEVAHALLMKGELPSLKEFLEDYASLGEIRAGFMGGSLIGFLRHEYGMDAVRELWIAGTDDLEDILGGDMLDFEEAWHRYLEDTVDSGVEVDLEAIDDQGCG